MAALVVDAYSASETARHLDDHQHAGPWNAKWVPTLFQLEAYRAAVQRDQDGCGGGAPPPSNVGRKR